MEAVTQWPASLVASLQLEPSKCVSMGWLYGTEREVDQLKHCEERWGLETRGSSLSSVASSTTWGTVGPQLRLQLRAMSESMEMQWQ